MSNYRKFGDLRVYRNGLVEGPTLRELQQKLSGKLEPYISRNKKRIYVASLVALTWLGPREPDQTHVIHLDYDPQNCKASNLRWATFDEYRSHWGRASGPPSVATLGKTSLPAAFYEFVHSNSHRGFQYVKYLLESSEWHDHGLSDYYLRDIVNGRVRRDLFLKYKKRH